MMYLKDRENCRIALRMVANKKFDPKSFEKLKKPERFQNENPDVIWENIRLKSDSIFIDIGCGVGFAAIPFARRMPDGTIYACDLEDEMLEMLKTELDSAGVKNVTPVKMEEVGVPLPDAIADSVLMQNLYHELDHGIDNLKECRRLMKKGGLMAVLDWKPMETPGGPPLEIRVEAKRIEEDLLEAGFNFVKSLELFPYHSFIVAENR
jgi:ubiquinone/menaquinone biosynthesis C-methylase UbiE